MWRIEFSSAEFLPCLPEGAQVNPDVYGSALRARGIELKHVED